MCAQIAIQPFNTVTQLLLSYTIVTYTGTIAGTTTVLADVVDTGTG